MNNPVGWFEIYVDDMERAKRFYQSVFALDLIGLHSMQQGGSIVRGLQRWICRA